MTTTKHTELPEKLEANNGCIWSENGSFIYHDRQMFDPAQRERGRQFSEAIVTRYNQHAELIRQRDELAGALQRLLRAFESDTEQVPHLDVKTCWQTNSAAIEQARQALTPTKET